MTEQQIINKIKELEFWMLNNSPSHPSYSVVSKDKQQYERKLINIRYDKGRN